MAFTLSLKLCSLAISNSNTKQKPLKPYNKAFEVTKLEPLCNVVQQPPCEQTLSTRRKVLVTIVAFNYGLMPPLASAEENPNGKETDDNDTGFAGAIKSLFDPNEKTKTGKSLPKAYLKSARDVVKNLRDSLKEDPRDAAKFRRTADSAKESIRDYLSNWRGQQLVSREESYALLEKAIRSLAGFYSKAGPSAAIPEEVKSEILGDLDTAEEFL